VGNAGTPLVIAGAGFGAEQGESYVTIGGVPPTSRSYLEWSDTSITVRVPEAGESALVYVHRGRQRSRPVLFAYQDALPKISSAQDTRFDFFISELAPAQGGIGALLSITGRGFGAAREGAAVLFPWDVRAPQTAPQMNATDEDLVEVNERENGYEFWSDREIRVRVPDGAGSGPVMLRMAAGGAGSTVRRTEDDAPTQVISPEPFTVTRKPGTKTIRDKRNYTIAYSVDVRVAEAEAPNTLYLWLPKPAASATQRTRQLLSRSAEPFVENFRGTSLFKYSDLANGSAARLSVSYLVEVYAEETGIVPEQVRNPVSAPAQYTQSSALIQSGDSEIIAASKAIIGRDTNQFLKARKIYNAVTAELAAQLSAKITESTAATEADIALVFDTVVRFCALARAAGIPCRPVSGVLIDRFRTAQNHYWAEFWVEDMGWVPVDPVLSAGAGPASFIPHTEGAAYYFGSIDNQRIAFSHGEVNLSPMDPRGRTVAHDHSYALQNLWEEAAGTIDSYSSLWSDIQVTGVYVH
jgi:transglutaminase-like putative cysteine protease